MTPVPKSVKRSLEVFAGFVGSAYYRRDPPYIWRTSRGWQRCSGQNFPISRRQMREHLFGGRLVFGSHGAFSPAWTALDLDRCLGEGARLTDEAKARLCAVDRAFSGAISPLRSSSSGNLHLWLHHAPMSVTLRDVCVDRQLAEYSSEAPSSNFVEIYPQPDVNFRWPFGLGSVLLEPGPLLDGVEVPVKMPKEEQIEQFINHPLYEFPSLADGLRDLRALKRDSRPLISVPNQPPVTPMIKKIDERVSSKSSALLM